MSDFGGVDAPSTKAVFENAFLTCYDLSPEKFQNLLIGVCADGASVNMGVHSGVCTVLKKDRPWLIIMQCMNHRF